MKGKNNIKIKEFLRKNGLFITLGLSVVLIGAATYFAYSQTSDIISDGLNSLTGADTSDTGTLNVNKNQTNVPKETTTAETTKITTTATTTEVTEAEEANVTAELTEPDMESSTLNSPVIMPVQGEVIGIFSGSELVKSNTTGAWQTHNGIDIKAALGDEVKAMTAGTVIEVKDDALWGICVTIDHGSGITSKYCSLNSGVRVQAGSEVASGDVIGAIGDSCEIESADESHLHFEVLQNGKYIDPVEFIRNGN